MTDPDSQVRPLTLIGVFAFSLFLSYTAILLRFISRRLSRTVLGPDDWIIFSSLPFTTTFIVISTVAVRAGLGSESMSQTSLGKRKLQLQILFACQFLYAISIAAFKISTLFLYRRIFPGRAFLRTLVGVGLLVLAYSITQMLGVLNCKPINAAWTLRIFEHCIHSAALPIVCGSINIATDVIILSLPLPRIWKLNISKTQKAQLIVLFLLGGLVCVISIIRTTTLNATPFPDQGFYTVKGLMWSILEIAVGTLCACLPTLRPLFRSVLGHKTLESRPGNGIGNRQIVEHPTPSDPGPLVTTSIGARPFFRLKDDARDEDEGLYEMPLRGVHQRATTDNGLPFNRIHITEDLEQSTVIHPSEQA